MGEGNRGGQVLLHIYKALIHSTRVRYQRMRKHNLNSGNDVFSLMRGAWYLLPLNPLYICTICSFSFTDPITNPLLLLRIRKRSNLCKRVISSLLKNKALLLLHILTVCAFLFTLPTQFLLLLDIGKRVGSFEWTVHSQWLDALRI